jgi:branched-chain amino acid transport system ATP-binding protein
MEILKVEQITKSFGGLKILQGISFSVEAGKKLALIGPNGAGKSTLLNVIGGQLDATSGTIVFADETITTFTPEKRLHRGLARSYQTTNLFFHISVLDNVLLSLYGAEKFHLQMIKKLEEQESLVKEAQRLLEMVGLWEKRKEILSSLSYGDQRLVELIASFASKPKMVLLDEPSAGLPTAEAASFANKVRQLAVDATLIFSAHDMDLVFNLADEIMVLFSGNILCKGSPEEIRCNKQVQAIYLGSED